MKDDDSRVVNGSTIEKDVPIPEVQTYSPPMRNHYPWQDLEVGESFQVNDVTTELHVRSIQQTASRAAGRCGIKLATRKMKNDNGDLYAIRIWRVE